MIRMVEDMFETSGTVDEAMYKELGGDVLPIGYRRRFAVLVAIYLLFSLLMLTHGENTMALILFAIACLCVTLYVRKKRSSVKLTLQRLRETNGQESENFVTRLDEECVYVKNETSGGCGTLRYEDIQRIVEVSKAFILISDGWQFVVVFKDGLSDRDTFLNYLFSRPLRAEARSIKKKCREN